MYIYDIIYVKCIFMIIYIDKLYKCIISVCIIMYYIHYITRSRDHESPGYETIIQVFCPLEIRRQAKVAIFYHPEN